jgi:hypothetical protein
VNKEDFIVHVTCGLCGGHALVNPAGAANQLTKGGYFEHLDPRVCARNIHAKQKKLNEPRK